LKLFWEEIQLILSIQKFDIFSEKQQKTSFHSHLCFLEIV
jgi:hypothetical protein